MTIRKKLSFTECVFAVKMQSTLLFGIKICLNTAFIEMKNGCHQRDPSGLEKHQTFEFSLPGDF